VANAGPEVSCPAVVHPPVCRSGPRGSRRGRGGAGLAAAALRNDCDSGNSVGRDSSKGEKRRGNDLGDTRDFRSWAA
jgi:hypothetical protein